MKGSPEGKMTGKNCFLNQERVCDLTCKAAFPVEDPLDPVDCYFIWLAAHFGEGLFDLRKMMDAGLGSDLAASMQSPPKSPTEDEPRGPSNN